jgi:hypothetical protein
MDPAVIQLITNVGVPGAALMWLLWKGTDAAAKVADALNGLREEVHTGNERLLTLLTRETSK